LNCFSLSCSFSLSLFSHLSLSLVLHSSRTYEDSGGGAATGAAAPPPEKKKLFLSLKKIPFF
jgi:hypothetical protein